MAFTSLDTISNADAYFATRANVTAWTSAGSPAKQTALNDATRFLDMFAYIGTKTDSAQEHQWPRSGILLNNVLLDKATIPQSILNALYEIAYAFVRGVDPERELKGANVVSRGFSSVRTTYDPGRTPEYILYGCPSGVAWLYLLPFLIKDGTGVIRLHRVN